MRDSLRAHPHPHPQLHPQPRPHLHPSDLCPGFYLKLSGPLSDLWPGLYFVADLKLENRPLLEMVLAVHSENEEALNTHVPVQPSFLRLWFL